VNTLILYDEPSRNFQGLSLAEQVENLAKQLGFNARARSISSSMLKPCTGCFGCWTKTPGLCVWVDDQANEINGELVGADVIILISNIVFGCYGSHIKSYLGRTIPDISPFFVKIGGESHHKKRYDNYPHFVAIGYGDPISQDEKETFQALVKRNSINFHSPKELALVIASPTESSIALERLTDFLSQEVLS